MWVEEADYDEKTFVSFAKLIGINDVYSYSISSKVEWHTVQKMKSQKAFWMNVVRLEQTNS